jgi:hypothetical protein
MSDLVVFAGVLTDPGALADGLMAEVLAASIGLFPFEGQAGEVLLGDARRITTRWRGNNAQEVRGKNGVAYRCGLGNLKFAKWTFALTGERLILTKRPDDGYEIRLYTFRGAGSASAAMEFELLTGSRKAQENVPDLRLSIG